MDVVDFCCIQLTFKHKDGCLWSVHSRYINISKSDTCYLKNVYNFFIAILLHFLHGCVATDDISTAMEVEKLTNFLTDFYQSIHIIFSIFTLYIHYCYDMLKYRFCRKNNLFDIDEKELLDRCNLKHNDSNLFVASDFLKNFKLLDDTEFIELVKDCYEYNLGIDETEKKYNKQKKKVDYYRTTKKIISNKMYKDSVDKLTELSSQLENPVAIMFCIRETVIATKLCVLLGEQFDLK